MDYRIIKLLTENDRHLWSNEILKIMVDNLRCHGINWPSDLRITEYHKVISSELHARIWPKDKRLFSRLFLEKDKISSLLGRILSATGRKKILDIEGIGYPEVYFRIVRPNESSDITDMHTDGAFYSITNKINEDEWDRWLKVWIPLYFEPDFNSLSLSKNSDKIKFNFDAQNFKDKLRPVFSQNNDVSVLDWQLPVRKFGEVAVFSPNTLHRAINLNASFTRLSFEFAIC